MKLLPTYLDIRRERAAKNCYGSERERRIRIRSEEPSSGEMISMQNNALFLRMSPNRSIAYIQLACNFARNPA